MFVWIWPPRGQRCCSRRVFSKENQVRSSAEDVIVVVVVVVVFAVIKTKGTIGLLEKVLFGLLISIQYLE